jgi:two-component system sensor histidine kinase MprB
LVAAVLAALLSRLVISPVTKLTQAAEKIARDPVARERINDEGTDEMARLSGAFNTMTERLQESNVQLQSALDSQKRFTGDAAHELRTPLTSISLAAENALHKEATVEDKELSLKTVLRSAQSMQALTSMLLSLSRLDSAEGKLLTTPTEILPILKSAVTATGLDNDPRLLWDVQNESTKQLLAPNAVLQIVTNLLENAAAYTPADGTITIKLRDTGIEVQDTGEGIAAEHLPHVFDRFYRADPARSRAKGGHGLGLAICKSLAEAQGADLTVTSKLGSGTTFTLRFSGSSGNS